MAWFALAQKLGMSVRRAKSEIGSLEFSQWMAFWRISADPDDRRTAMICTMIAKGAGSKDARVEQFMPHIKRPAMSVNRMKAGLMRALPGTNEPKLR